MYWSNIDDNRIIELWTHDDVLFTVKYCVNTDNKRGLVNNCPLVKY